MAPGATLEIVDFMFQDLIGVQIPFGGKVVVLGGDFGKFYQLLEKDLDVPLLLQQSKNLLFDLVFKYSN